MLLRGSHFLPLFLASRGFLSIDYSYRPLMTLRDATTGLYVELAEFNTMSAYGYVVMVFEDAGPRPDSGPDWNPVIYVAGPQSEPPSLVVKDRCYVLEVEYRYGGLVAPEWKDQKTGKTLCFDLVPDRGPKGGFTP